MELLPYMKTTVSAYQRLKAKCINNNISRYLSTLQRKYVIVFIVCPTWAWMFVYWLYC